jgi:hypothetical protein
MCESQIQDGVAGAVERLSELTDVPIEAPGTFRALAQASAGGESALQAGRLGLGLEPLPFGHPVL